MPPRPHRANVQAADALAVTGVGRNEYIAALNACKARRLMWRVNINRDSIVREQLPTVSGLPGAEGWMFVLTVYKRDPDT